jgi:hypothetical protein
MSYIRLIIHFLFEFDSLCVQKCAKVRKSAEALKSVQRRTKVCNGLEMHKNITKSGSDE